MTINEVIAQVDHLLENEIPHEVKIAWLSALDHLLYLDVILTHEGGGEVSFEPYTAYDGEKALLIGHPYDNLIYPEYLKMKINGELYESVRYNNNMLAFNSALAEWKAYYNRNHLPVYSPNMNYGRPL